MEAAEDGVTAWIPSVVTQVLEDGWFQARIGRGKRRGEESDWFDWFTWQERSDWRRPPPPEKKPKVKEERLSVGGGGEVAKERESEERGREGHLKLKSMRKKLRLRLRIDHEAETATILKQEPWRAPAGHLLRGYKPTPRHRRDRAAARQLGRRARRHARAPLLGPTLDDWVEGEIVNHTASGKHGTRIWFIKAGTLDFGDEQASTMSPSPIIPSSSSRTATTSPHRRSHQRRSAAASRRQSVSLRSLAHGLPQRAW